MQVSCQLLLIWELAVSAPESGKFFPFFGKMLPGAGIDSGGGFR